MPNIRPVSDLRNKFPEIEEAVFTDDVEPALDEADRAAGLSDVYYSGEEVFSRVRGRAAAICKN